MNLADMDYGLTLEVVGGNVCEKLHENVNIHGRGPWKRLVAEVFEAVAMHKRAKTTSHGCRLLDLHSETIHHCCNCFPELSVGRS